MSKRLDITGSKFNRWTIIEFHGIKNNSAYWKCQCDCGKTAIVKGSSIISEKSKSCGCINSERLKSESFIQNRVSKTKKHQMYNKPIYNSWDSMLQRCNNKNHKNYIYYGGRGIKVCERWHIFENFYADMGDRPSLKYSIDRIDVNGDYEPSNCKWSTTIEQMNNTNRNHYLKHNGEKHTIFEWASILNINKSTLNNRIFKGWSIEKALTTPVRKKIKRE